MPNRLPDANDRNTIQSVYREAVGALRSVGVASPELDARILVSAAANISYATFIADPDRTLSQNESVRLDAFLARRTDREPVSRILGSREFWDHDFLLSPETLDPRADSETLVQAVLEALPNWRMKRDTLKILDLGTGTGALLLTLLSEIDGASGVGTDITQDALQTAQRNADRLGLCNRAAFVATSWFDGLRGTFDIVVSNPPYIRRGDIAQLDPEVTLFDPMLALDGGPDGLACYRHIAAGLAQHLNPGGLIALEVGKGQDRQVAGMLAEAALGATIKEPQRHRDLAGIVRCLTLIGQPQKGVGNSNRSG